MRAPDVFESYLRRVGVLEAVRLGDRHRVVDKAPKPEDREALRTDLRTSRQSSMVMVWVMTMILVSVFIVGVGLVLRAAQNPLVAATAAVGTLVSLLVVVDRLRRIWVEKTMLDIAGAAVSEWEPDQVLKLMELVYWHSIRSGSETARSAAKAARR